MPHMAQSGRAYGTDECPLSEVASSRGYVRYSPLADIGSKSGSAGGTTP